MSSASPADRVPIRTGPLTAVLVEGALRDVRVGGRRALDAVYAAVRDPGWGTVPGTFLSYEVRVSDTAFAASFTRRHGDFEWDGRISGDGGAVTVALDGRVLAPFAANRIGFCLLHPIELAGRAVRASTPHGKVAGCFPDRIAPHQPFLDLIGLGYEVGPGAWLDVAFEGDLFEMEDHRNWTDAGWKTYCTPLRRPYPVAYRTGDTVRQTVRITARGADQPVAAGPGEPTVTVGDQETGRLPAIGVTVTGPLPHGAVERLRALDLDHVHALLPGDGLPTMPGARLDVTVLGEGNWDETTAALVRHRGPLGRVTVVDPATGVTPAGAAPALRTALAARGVRVPVGGGTVANFAELNRMDLPAGELDFVTYGVSPQLHHEDAESIMDTLLAQPHTVRDARLVASGRPVVVRPVTLHRPGHGPDPRQLTDLLAAWTVGSLAGLAGADAVTYFEATGPAGLFLDPAEPFPVWRVLAALAGLRGAPLYRVAAPPREVAALAVGPRLLVANLRDMPRTVRVIDRGRTSHLELGAYGVAAVDR